MSSPWSHVLDPDRAYFSGDKYAHGAYGFALGVMEWALRLQDHFWQFVGVGLLVSIAYELGQTDADHSAGQLGKPGHGFGLLDLVWDMKGVLFAYLLLRTLCQCWGW